MMKTTHTLVRIRVSPCYHADSCNGARRPSVCEWLAPQVNKHSLVFWYSVCAWCSVCVWISETTLSSYRVMGLYRGHPLLAWGRGVAVQSLTPTYRLTQLLRSSKNLVVCRTNCVDTVHPFLLLSFSPSHPLSDIGFPLVTFLRFHPLTRALRF